MPNSRTHIVMVPGFVGFDGLGQLAYYAGTTDLFKTWKAANPRAADAVLHYFDNFPTASVATRAFRLREFLTKMIARGEIAEQDHISLVGHSTGGLDIRRLLSDLADTPGDATLVDGPKKLGAPEAGLPGAHAVGVQHDAILSRNRTIKVAFLSVPHHGTNIASFIDESHYREIIRSLLRLARVGLEANRGSLPDLVEPFLSRNPLNSEIPLAILDALRESDLRAGGERERAYEREAQAALLLWLGHMESDFGAIDDLRVGSPEGSASPAHFDADKRRQEIARCEQYGIRTRSYATRATAPATILSRSQIIGTVSGELAKASLRASVKVATAGVLRAPQVMSAGLSVLGNTIKAAPALLMQALATLPVLPGALRHAPGNVIAALRTALGNHTADLVFGIAYSMCAYQPFPGRRFTLAQFGQPQQPSVDIGPFDSDGVVNTLSMAFHHPQDANGNHQTFLVDACDHADIIGHYALQETRLPNEHGRQYSRYDFFKSGSAFGAERFQRIWEDVFDFCA